MSGKSLQYTPKYAILQIPWYRERYVTCVRMHNPVTLAAHETWQCLRHTIVDALGLQLTCSKIVLLAVEFAIVAAGDALVVLRLQHEVGTSWVIYTKGGGLVSMNEIFTVVCSIVESVFENRSRRKTE